MLQYDVVVIGAGPGGYVCAIRTAQLGKKTAVVERQFLGGVCLNVGCIPSKALLKNAEVAHTLRHRGKEFGFQLDGLRLDYAEAVKRSRQVSNRLVKGVAFLMKKNGIDVHNGQAVFTGPHALRVMADDGSTTEISAQHVVIATGASAAMLPGVQADGTRVLTYLEAILQEKLPQSVVIVGAGAIGLEFATVWNSYGAEVTIVEMLPRIAPLEDEEVSAELGRAMSKRGIKLLPGTKVEKVETLPAKVQVTVSGSQGEQALEAEQALIAIGFRPNTKELGLEAAGVQLDSHGFVQIDERMATSVPGVWAIGDVTGKLMLAHVASAMGIVAAESIAGVPSARLDYEQLPRATYSQPQVASFGLSEAQARERGLEIKVARFPFLANGKALGSGDYAGWIKLVVEASGGRILGAHLVGPEVTELLPELTLARMINATAADIARNVHAHPTLSEVIMEVAHAIEGHAINA